MRPYPFWPPDLSLMRFPFINFHNKNVYIILLARGIVESSLNMY